MAALSPEMEELIRRKKDAGTAVDTKDEAACKKGFLFGVGNPNVEEPFTIETGLANAPKINWTAPQTWKRINLSKGRIIQMPINVIEERLAEGVVTTTADVDSDIKGDTPEPKVPDPNGHDFKTRAKDCAVHKKKARIIYFSDVEARRRGVVPYEQADTVTVKFEGGSQDLGMSIDGLGRVVDLAEASVALQHKVQLGWILAAVEGIRCYCVRKEETLLCEDFIQSAKATGKPYEVTFVKKAFAIGEEVKLVAARKHKPLKVGAVGKITPKGFYKDGKHKGRYLVDFGGSNTEESVLPEEIELTSLPPEPEAVMYFGCGRFFPVQHALYMLEREFREPSMITARAAYAGSELVAAGGLVCQHNADDVADYAQLGHAEVVQVEIPASKFSVFVKEYFDNICVGGQRVDDENTGDGFRSLIGIPDGPLSSLYPMVQKAAGNVRLLEGVGGEKDTKGSVFIYDSKLFPPHVAESDQQFHPDDALSPWAAEDSDEYDDEYFALKNVCRSTDCPNDRK
jgi:hypothetical protein